jgi:MscS family membrane protein
MLSTSEIQTQLCYIRDFFGEFSWAIVILLSSFVSAYVLRLILLKYKNKFDKSGHFGWYALLQAITTPIFFLLIFIGLFFGIDAIESVHLRVKDFLLVLKKFSFILCAFWFLISYLNIYEKRFYGIKEKTIGGIDKRTVNALIKISRALAILIAIMFVLDIFGIDIRGILTIAGIGGAAIGFAAKDMIANFFGAIMLFIDKPFAVGDSIKLSNGEEGTVEYIGWRITKLRTTNTTCVYIANSLFSNTAVENQSMMTHRRMQQTLKLKYSDITKLETVTKEIRTALFNFSKIDNKKRIDCFLSEFSESSVNCEVSAFTKTINKLESLELNQKIMIKIAKIITKHKLKIAFPIRDVKLTNHK